MFYALNSEGTRIHATKANKEEKYICPVCGEVVYPKQGTLVAHHFAHKNECRDSWHYEEMTPWHKEWQERFPEECREVVVVNDLGEKHRADVMVDDIVIEFQHSPISSKDFNARNKFYLDLNKRLIWVFDKREDIGVSILEVDDSDTLYQWKRYPKVLSNAFDLIDDCQDFAIALDIGNNVLVRITSCISDNSGNPSLSYFNSKVWFTDEDDFDFNDIFYTDVDRYLDLLKDLDTYVFKNVFGYRGGDRGNTYCERRRSNKLYSMGNDACSHCRYCAGLILTEDIEYRQVKKTERAICTYPKQCREVVDDPCYEPDCEQADMYYL